MNKLRYSAAKTRGEALDQQGQGDIFYSGGTDLLPLMKQSIIAPSGLIDIKQCDLPAGLSATGSGFSLGALTTLAEIARDARLESNYRVLVEAASSAATPQLRNRATLGGNLLQRPRCWYYRHPDIDCWLKGGEDCPAREGQNQQHAIFNDSLNDSPCVAVHPSDLAPALMALGAEVTLLGPRGERQLPIDELYHAPTSERRRETTNSAEELLVSVELPWPAPGTRSAYYKAMDRKVWAFALASVAVVKAPPGQEWRVVLGGVAATPLRLHAVEHQLASLDPGAPEQAALEKISREAVAHAAPLSNNRYKMELVQRLLTKAVSALAGEPD